MDMIEKLAQAIFNEFVFMKDGDYVGEYKALGGTETQLDGHFDLNRIALAAIKAMREPTKEMIEAGDKAQLALGMQEMESKDTFEAMIDAALAPLQSPKT